jgi:pimeloyl-ACP methyl ester carboxylesterase
VLLIHGLGSSGADWALQMLALEGRFRVIAPDLPGSGDSAPPAGGYSIEGFAEALWRLLDRLEVSRVNIVGFSMGGAVALEMAVRRPGQVARLALINSLTTYRIDHWRKWLEARVPALLIPLLGMRIAASLVAQRLFPEPSQRPLRERAAAVVSRARAAAYLQMAVALERWSAADRLHRLRCKTLMIAAERDYTALAEKYAMAAAMRADIAVVRDSRHGTPFDSVEATNACLLSLLTDQALPAPGKLVRDLRPPATALARALGMAEEHALGRQPALRS